MLIMKRRFYVPKIIIIIYFEHQNWIWRGGGYLRKKYNNINILYQIEVGMIEIYM